MSYPLEHQAPAVVTAVVAGGTGVDTSCCHTDLFPPRYPLPCAPRANSSYQMSELPPLRGLTDRSKLFAHGNLPPHFSFRYPSSSPAHTTGIWAVFAGHLYRQMENQLVRRSASASPGAMLTTSPGRSSCGSLPHS